MESVSVIIPTLNAEKSIGTLLTALKAQTLKFDEIIVIDSSSVDNTVKITEQMDAKCIVIPRKEFDHGGTRHKAFMETSSEFVMFMTQDAIPADKDYSKKLVSCFSNKKIGMASGRQIARKDARLYEKIIREYNYPHRSFLRNKKDFAVLGIKTFLVSDVCSAYRRTAYLDCGGFDFPCNTNEDMLMAAKMIDKGYQIAYVAEAEVIHSHNLSFMQQYRRNKEIGLFIEEHKSLLMNASESSEGIKLIEFVTNQLLRRGTISEIVAFYLDCVARFLGNKAGHAAARRL